MRGAGTSASKRSTPVRAVDLWASGEHAGPLPARLEPVAGALAVVVRRADRYLTVSVPSMPWARCPVMLQ